MISILGRAALAAATIGGGTAAVALGTGGSSPAPAPAVMASGSDTTATSTVANCDTDANWPAYVQGAPTAFDAHGDGIYLWHNPSGGWSLRVSHPVLPGGPSKVVFTGAIRSRGDIGNVKPVRDEKGDVAKVGPKGHGLRFRFVDSGGVDGLDFTTSCTPGLVVVLKVDRQAAGTPSIHLGANDAHPGSDPFGIRRREGDTATVTPKAHAHRRSNGTRTTTPTTTATSTVG